VNSLCSSMASCSNPARAVGARHAREGGKGWAMVHAERHCRRGHQALAPEAVAGWGSRYVLVEVEVCQLCLRACQQQPFGGGREWVRKGREIEKVRKQ